MTTYTDEEVQALAKELAEYKTKVEELESVRREQSLESRIAEVRAELETRIAELQKELDTAVLEAEKARNEREEIVAWLNSEAERQEAAEAAKARRDERLAKVREVASFPEEYLERNADRWSALDEDEFASLVSDWQLIGSKPAETPSSTIPAETAMAQQSRKDESASWKQLFRDVASSRLNGVDTRNL